MGNTTFPIQLFLTLYKFFDWKSQVGKHIWWKPDVLPIWKMWFLSFHLLKWNLPQHQLWNDYHFWLTCVLCSISVLICVAIVGWSMMWVLSCDSLFQLSVLEDLFHCYLSHQVSFLCRGSVTIITLIFVPDALLVDLFVVFFYLTFHSVVVNWLCVL